MSTGLETWNQNLTELGPLYPFVGTEVILSIAGIVVWIIWHLVQIRGENATDDAESQRFSDKARLAKAMEVSNAGTLAGSIEGHASDFDNGG